MNQGEELKKGHETTLQKNNFSNAFSASRMTIQWNGWEKKNCLNCYYPPWHCFLDLKKKYIKEFSKKIFLLPRIFFRSVKRRNMFGPNRKMSTLLKMTWKGSMKFFLKFFENFLSPSLKFLVLKILLVKNLNPKTGVTGGY